MTLTRPELQEYLKIPQLDNESVLEFLINKYKQSVELRGVSETYVQTEDTPVTGLETRLRLLDSEFLTKTRTGHESFEERILKVRQECEEKARIELNSEIFRVKEVEISQVRLEEAAKYREQLRVARNELEEVWKSQLDELKARERESKERLVIREKDLEVREFRQREIFEKEMEILRSKEKDLKKAAEIELESAKLQKKSWEQKKIDYESKLKEMEIFKSNMSTKAIDDFNQFKRHFEAQFDEEKRKIINDKFELQANRDLFELEIEKVKKTEEKLKEKTRDLKETHQKMTFFQENYEKLSAELSKTREDLRILTETSKRDLDLLAFKDQELQAVRNECQVFKDLYQEQKEDIKRLETTNQAILNKIMSEENAKTNSVLQSEFLAERQHLWRHLDKESTEIRKEMNDLVTGSDSIRTVFKSSIQPTFKTFVSVAGRSQDSQIRPKTEFIQNDNFFTQNETKAEKNPEKSKTAQIEITFSQPETFKELPQQSKTIPRPNILIEHEESSSYKSSSRKIEPIEESIHESIQESLSDYEKKSEESKKSSKIPEKKVTIDYSDSSEKGQIFDSQESGNSDDYF
jgi:hypothetical protein